ncbi:hypothetical protein EVA_15383 [gut metagenome]|uniref:Uncharacterized protein n=1 Tax=gut metagenome TaxID=749906 RepID=J9C9D4_9ZZZZ
MFRQRAPQVFMRHVSPSGLYSSCYSWNPADILFPQVALTSICILIIRRIWKMEISAESLPRN